MLFGSRANDAPVLIDNERACPASPDIDPQEMDNSSSVLVPGISGDSTRSGCETKLTTGELSITERKAMSFISLGFRVIKRAQQDAVRNSMTRRNLAE